MFVLKTSRRKNSIISVNRTKPFRSYPVIFNRVGNAVFLNTFNNIYVTYIVTTVGLPNGTYQLKVTSTDALQNEDAGTTGSIVVSYVPLPPKNLDISVSGNDVTLTWEVSVNGAPDNYIIYGNGGTGGDIDRTTILATLAGNILSDTITVASGQWKFIVESKVGGITSNTLMIVSSAVPTTVAIPPKPGPANVGPLAVTGLNLKNISVGKVQIQFLWLYGSQASTFNVYHDSGTGIVNYGAPAFVITRAENFIQTYTTTQLIIIEGPVTYKFVVRAVSPSSVEETNTDEYSIPVDGVAPSNPLNLQLSVVY